MTNPELADELEALGKAAAEASDYGPAHVNRRYDLGEETLNNLPDILSALRRVEKLEAAVKGDVSAARMAHVLQGKLSRGEIIDAEAIDRVLELVIAPRPEVTDADREWALQMARGLPAAPAASVGGDVIGVLSDFNACCYRETCRAAAGLNVGLAALLKDSQAVHLNMLRGGIAKLTPEQIGHMYRGDEGLAVIAEIVRQNPERGALSGGPAS